MSTFNDILPNLIQRFPSIVNKETVEKLVLADKNALSFETANACMAALGTSEKPKEEETSTENHHNADLEKGDFDTQNDRNFTLEESVRRNFANVKFASLVDFAKQEDTFLYTEFVDMDAARDRIASEIVAKYENDFNSFLVALKTAQGADKDIIDSLIQTKIHVGELN